MYTIFYDLFTFYHPPTLLRPCCHCQRHLHPPQPLNLLFGLFVQFRAPSPSNHFSFCTSPKFLYFLPIRMDTEATTRMAKTNAAQLDEEEKSDLKCLSQAFHRDKRRENKSLLVAPTKESWTSIASFQSQSHAHVKDNLHEQNDLPLPLLSWSAGPLPSIVMTCQNYQRRDALIYNLREAARNLTKNGHNVPFNFQAYKIGNEAKNVLWSIDFTRGNIPSIQSLS